MIHPQVTEASAAAESGAGLPIETQPNNGDRLNMTHSTPRTRKAGGVTRRQVLGTLAAATLLPCGSLMPIEHVGELPGKLTLAAWLERFRPALSELARRLADCEAAGVHDKDRAAFYLNDYRAVMEWRTGVCMAYGFGPSAKSILSHAATRAKIDAAGIGTLAAGWSHDRRAWTLFLLADRKHVAEVLGIHGENSTWESST